MQISVPIFYQGQQQFHQLYQDERPMQKAPHHKFISISQITRIADYEIPWKDYFCVRYYISDHIQDMMKIKGYSLIQPVDTFIQGNQLIAVYLNLHQFKLTRIVIQNLDRMQVLQIVLTIALTLSDMYERGIPINIITMEHLLWIEETLFINTMYNDYIAVPSVTESWKTLYNVLVQLNQISDLFKQYLELFSKAVNFKDYIDRIINNFDECKQMAQNSDGNEPKYLQILYFILHVQQQQLLNDTNSFVYQCSSPPSLQHVNQKQERIVIKTIRKDPNQDRKETQKNANQELQLYERFNPAQPTDRYFGYVRIGEQIYLLLHQYATDLNNYLNLIEQGQLEKMSKIVVYQLCKQFAYALKRFHENECVHLDLKPGNLFLTNQDPTKGIVLLADFDKSKEQGQNYWLGGAKLNDNTYSYDAPEIGHSHFNSRQNSFKADIWQYGLICYQIANQGVYAGYACGAYALDAGAEYESVFGYQTINETLSKYKYSEEFIKLLANCLSYKPENRLNMNQIYPIINSLNLEAKINKLGPSNIQAPRRPRIEIISVQQRFPNQRGNQ